MIHPKRLAQLVRTKGQDNLQRRRSMCTTLSVADKEHCAVHTADRRQFEVPLAYLGTTVFGELLKMSKEEFGFTIDGRITLPFDAVVME
jgi:hypothetical protein